MTEGDSVRKKGEKNNVEKQKCFLTWRGLLILPAILTSLLHRICCCPFFIFILLWNVKHWASDQCEQGHEQSAKEELQKVLNSVYSWLCQNMVQYNNMGGAALLYGVIPYDWFYFCSINWLCHCFAKVFILLDLFPILTHYNQKLWEILWQI